MVIGDVAANPITGPVSTLGFTPSSAPPSGYWINPANPTQWLTQADAAKIGGYCIQGPAIGRYKVGGNNQSTALYCGSLSCQETALIYGGLSAALWLLLPGGWKWLALLPAGYVALDCTLGQVTI